jgi:hypothetical protein
VCNFIAQNLKPYGVEVVRTDDITGKTDITLANRVKKMNEVNPRIVVSIHHNAGSSDGKFGNYTGTEVLYHTKGTAEDKKLAEALAPSISSKCRLKNRGVKTAVLGVLNCKFTAVLCEGGFMDGYIDTAVICSEAGQKAYADGVTEGIVKYLGLKLTPVFIPTTKPTSNNYVVTAIVGLNCRYGPGIKYKITKKYKYKESIKVDFIDKGWAKTNYGYVSTAWIKKI